MKLLRLAATCALFFACGGSSKPKTSTPAPSSTSAYESAPSVELFPGIGTLDDAVVNTKAEKIAIVGATILTAAGQTIDKGTILLSGGAIVDLGAGLAVPDGYRKIDGSGRFVTPGIIDSHSHIGVYAAPGDPAHSDGNEAVAPTTAQARSIYGFWPHDPQIPRARAGGVTTALILPGSANIVGGTGFVTIMRPGGVASENRFPGAKPSLKMACGENPKRVYGEKGGPQTRMGLYAAFRATYHKAREYKQAKERHQQALEKWESGDKKEPPPAAPAIDLGMETLAAVLRDEVLVQVHCYRADDIRQLVEISNQFGFKIRSFHHAIEAYKVRDLLVANDISISTWTEWWGFKLEAMDGIVENAALMTAAGGRAIIHSDDAKDIQHLNQEAAKGMYAARAAGIEISEDQALRWITANPAWALGIDKVTGTLEKGKRADVVLWSGHPFSVYSLPDLVIQGGELAYDRAKGRDVSDFELGNSASDHTNANENRN